MKALYATIISFVLFLAGYGYGADLRPSDQVHISAFYAQGDVQGWPVTVRGIVHSLGTRQDIPVDSVAGHTFEKSAVTVRLFSAEQLKPGDELFIINDNNLITGRIKVVSIFKSISFGHMLTGTGNFRMCSVRDRVVQRREEAYSDRAVVRKSRGDYYMEHGNEGRAMAEYKKALELDKGNPDVHLALGWIYYKQDILRFAYREFEEANKNLYRLYDNEDKYSLFKGMALIRLREIRELSLSAAEFEVLRKQGIAHCQKALKLYPDSVEANYWLGLFHYTVRGKGDEDTAARDSFLKVVELDPEHEGANIALARLYLKHGNKDKAELYAIQALKSSPSGSQARELLESIRSRR